MNASTTTASHAVRNYAIVTAAYWGFTLTDGALRMLVLLHFYKLGYSPFTLAFLFLLYEAAGVLANLIGGWLATRYGIKRMLTVGLFTEITGFLLMSALSPTWSVALSVAWVALITIIFIIPLYKIGLPWEDGFDWQFTNYTILWFAAIGLIFGGWWVLSARKWFKGPIRMGSEEELDRIEERYEHPAGPAPAGK